MNISKIFLIWVLLFTVIFLPQSMAQYLSTPKLSGVGLPYFNAEIFPTFSKDGQQRLIRVYVQMVNDDITFLKADTGYQAELQIEIYISRNEQQYLFSRTVNKKVFVNDFEATNSREILNTFFTDIPVDTGSYEATITVRDLNSNKQVNRKIHFTIPSFHQNHFLASNLLFFSECQKDSLGNIIAFEPNLTNNFSSSVEFIYVYFNTFLNATDDALKISYRIKDGQGFIVQQNEYVLQNKQKFQEHFLRFNRHYFDRNKYTVELNIALGNYTFSTERYFTFYWTISPESPHDLDIALQQMIYIADEDSIEYFLKADFNQKKAYFIRFWKRMDPDPNTEKNELLDEYYRRVNFANQNFSTMTLEGWKTDRGRIFIKFGEPDDIERHPFEMSSYPYEIWRYYRLRKVFLFIDRTGFGDYYLHPAFFDEEYN